MGCSQGVEEEVGVQPPLIGPGCKRGGAEEKRGEACAVGTLG